MLENEIQNMYKKISELKDLNQEDRRIVLRDEFHENTLEKVFQKHMFELPNTVRSDIEFILENVNRKKTKERLEKEKRVLFFYNQYKDFQKEVLPVAFKNATSSEEKEAIQKILSH